VNTDNQTSPKDQRQDVDPAKGLGYVLPCSTLQDWPGLNASRAELENAMQLVDPHRDALYRYDAAAQKAANDAHPWRSDPHHFKSVRVSAVALLKMVMHARSGGSIEVMGLMQGYVSGGTVVVTDALRLPVEGTETRVNAQDEANEYMVTFLQRAREAGQADNAVGWYHSHPGYGCWLSGIDVDTQATQQTFSDPFVAVVVDPDRTISAGRVEIGAFRTYPDGYSPAAAAAAAAAAQGGSGSDGGTIPQGKVEDFGAHAHRYYSLEVTHFKSTLDATLLEALWGKYWAQTLSASAPSTANREYGTKQMADLALKVRQAEGAVRGAAKSVGPQGMGLEMGGARQRGQDELLDKVVRAGDKIAAEEQAGVLAAQLKERLFGGSAAKSAR